MKAILPLLLLSFFISSSARGQQNWIKSDSLERWPFFRSMPSAMNYIHNDNLYNGVEAYEFGNYVNNEKVGVWEVRDNNNNLIGHRVYIDDTTEFEVQYKNDRILSIVISKSEPSTIISAERNYRLGLQKEIISFDRKGKIGSWLIWQKPVDTNAKRPKIIRLR